MSVEWFIIIWLYLIAMLPLFVILDSPAADVGRSTKFEKTFITVGWPIIVPIIFIYALVLELKDM